MKQSIRLGPKVESYKQSHGSGIDKDQRQENDKVHSESQMSFPSTVISFSIEDLQVPRDSSREDKKKKSL